MLKQSHLFREVKAIRVRKSDAGTKDLPGGLESSGTFELWRRLLLLLSLAVGFWLFAYASPAPLVRLEGVDMQRQQRREIERPFATETQRQLAALPLEAYVQAIAGDDLLMLQGAAWPEFTEALNLLERRVVPKEWKHRVQAETLKSGYTPRIYFHPEEAPVAGWFSHAGGNTDSLYLVIENQGSPPTYAKLTYLPFPLEELRIGGGSALDLPPSGMIRRARPFGYGVMLAGLLMYGLLPRPRRYKGAITHPRFKVWLADVAMVMLFLVFYAMPFLISGGSLQAVTIALPLTVIFWGMAGLSLWIMYINAWTASFEMVVTNDSLAMGSYRGHVVVPFGEVESFQPVVKESPRWMRRMTWLGFLVSKGSMKFLMASQLVTGAGTMAQGIRLNLRGGDEMDFWITDQWQQEMLVGGSGLVHHLETAGIPRIPQPATDRKLSYLPASGAWQKSPMVVPLLVMLAVMGIVISGSFLM
ncbi:hypothetical protein [Anoxynatronum buryatiense]|uniref:Uncharacterized protein n=1 Tax=Anoxynatronum buryatiense TaxID=489973 RepID=A0AA45WXQ1_9CLOT|nr:hypothetical protein [Anoxynatronum buryatiense]SMP65275.1 hypothetical protein SAMN06296020_11295 [Anoxynatronum buryatiense]